MSQETEETVQRFFDAVERLLQVSETSRSLLDAMNAGDMPPEASEALGYMAPEVAWNPLFSGEIYSGHLDVAGGLDELREAASDYNSKLLETTDLGADRVLAVFALSLEGRGSGINIDAKVFAVVRFHDGLITRIDEYADRTEALEAVGLSEQMSQESLELVRGAFAEFERGNFWVGDIFHPHVRIVWLDALAGGETESLGVESMAATVREWLRTWERMTMTAERITAVGDQVLVIATWRGRGITSEAPAEWRHGQVWTMRDGQVISLVSFPDPAEAVEAVGLSE